MYDNEGELDGVWDGAAMASSRLYPDTPLLEQVRDITKHLNHVHRPRAEIMTLFLANA
jgi:hypothetical protein